MTVKLEKTIQHAAELLHQGKLVAFPTETVYGLGAGADIPAAIQKIFLVKGRPADHPLIVHLHNFQQLSEWAKEIPVTASQLAEKFWPGPLTLILPKAPAVSNLITGNQETIGIRIPAHPIAQALLKAYGTGIVAPSANRFGKVSPTLASHVFAEFGKEIDLILEGGACEVGIESTIVDLSGEKPRILRPGIITASQLSEVIGLVEIGGQNTPRVSGNLLSHYAPKTPLKIVTLEELKSIQDNAVILALQPPLFKNPSVKWLQMPQDPATYAHELYAKLREIDALGYQLILVEKVPQTEKWLGILDRLQKAEGADIL